MQANDATRFVARHRWPVGLAVLALFLTLFEWLEWPFMRLPVERLLARGLERPVAVGKDFGLRIFGPVRLRGGLLVIGSPPHGPSIKDAASRPRDLLRAEDFHLSLSWPTLLRLVSGDERPVHIRRLEVANVDAALRRDADGRANWQFGKRDRTDEQPLPSFDHLVVTEGRIGLEDEVLQLMLDATVRTHEGGDVPTAAGGAVGLEIAASGRYRGEALTARLRSSGLLPLAAASADAPVVPLKLDLNAAGLELHLDGQGRDLLHLQAFNGRFDLKGRSLSAVGDALKVALPTTGPFSMNGHLGKDGPVWHLLVDRLAVGSSRLNGRFRYDRTAPVPVLSGELGGARLTLPDLVPAFGGRVPGTLPDGPRERLLPTREFDLPALGVMDADVAVSIESFMLGTAFLEPLEPLKGRVTLHRKVLAIDKLQARASGGELRGKLTLDARESLPRWHIDVSWSGVDLARFVRARNPTAKPDVKSPRSGRPRQDGTSGYVSGVLGGRARLQGSGRSTAAMLASLDGASQWWVSDGRISRLLMEVVGLDIAQSLGLLVGGDQRLPIRCAVASLAVRDGVVRPEVAVIDTELTTTSAVGEISLADERLALRLTANPRNVSPMTLRSPVRIEGTFADPEVRLDPVSIGSRVAAATALAVVTPAAALLALIDLGDPAKAVCSDALKRMERHPKKP